jgi:hypothetical protein
MYKLDRKPPIQEMYSQNQLQVDSTNEFDDEQRYGVN